MSSDIETDMLLTLDATRKSAIYACVYPMNILFMNLFLAFPLLPVWFTQLQ